jgi:hypothetical protein
VLEFANDGAIIAVGGGADESLPEMYASIAAGRWALLTDSLQIGPGGVFLMHAAGVPGSEDELAFDTEVNTSYATIGQAIVYPFPAGPIARK